MIILLIKYLLIAISGVGIALAATCAFHGGGKLKGKFWRMDYVLFRIANYPVNGFHVSQSIAIISLCSAIFLGAAPLVWCIKVIIAGAAYIIPFNLFFNKILK